MKNNTYSVESFSANSSNCINSSSNMEKKTDELQAFKATRTKQMVCLTRKRNSIQIKLNQRCRDARKTKRHKKYPVCNVPVSERKFLEMRRLLDFIDYQIEALKIEEEEVRYKK